MTRTERRLAERFGLKIPLRVCPALSEPNLPIEMNRGGIPIHAEPCYPTLSAVYKIFVSKALGRITQNRQAGCA